MNTRNPYGPMVQQQMAPQQQPMPPQQQQPQIQARPMQFQRPGVEQPAPKKDDGGMMSMMSSGGGQAMSAMSDERSKKEIARLESANDALAKALSSKAEYPDTGASSAGMQALGQQSAPPSRASFPGAPADRVAAQNVALRQQGATPQAQGPQPGQSEIRNPWGVQTQMPNMSDLDEAYARMGRGG